MSDKKTPYQFGRFAFDMGQPCGPALDQMFLNTCIADAQVGERIKLLDEWIKGWTDANLALQVVRGLD